MNGRVLLVELILFVRHRVGVVAARNDSVHRTVAYVILHVGEQRLLGQFTLSGQFGR